MRGTLLAILSISLPLAAQRVTTGMASTGSTVSLFSGGAFVSGFEPFSGFTGGARVAMGDVNGDGFSDYVVGAGPGGSPTVTVFSGVDGSVIRSFLAYAPGFTGGVFVACADFDADGKADVVTGADAGGAPEVKVFSGANGSVLKDFFAFSPSFTGGVRVAAGDVNMDGTPDIVAAEGAGGAPTVTVFSGTDLSVVTSFLAYAPAFAGGVYVAAGDVDGDGHADVVTGAGGGGGPEVMVFSGANGSAIRDFLAFAPAFTGGVTVASGRIDGDALDDVVAATASAGGQVIAFRSTDLATLQSFLPYGGAYTGGVFVASSGATPLPVRLERFAAE